MEIDESKRAPTLVEIAARQRRSVGYLLIRSAQLLNERGIQRVNREKPGFVFREAHTRLVPYLLEPEGIRITDLARRVSVSKQAAHALVREMVRARVVRLVPDPEDGRARRVILTARGARAIHHGTGILLGIDEELTRIVGPRKMRKLLELLRDLLGALDSHDPSGPD